MDSVELMDQPRIAQHATFFMNDEDHHHIHLGPPRNMQTVHKSEPHLHVPHLLVSQDEGHPSLNRIVSGLFRVNEALRTPHSSCSDLQGLHKSDDITTNSSTSFPQPSSLRKSSSAADWNTTYNTSKTSQNVTVAEAKCAHSYHGMALSSASPTGPPPLNPLPTRPRSNHHEESLLRGIFHRGFLSKPVGHSDEENHRYLMTLDR